MAYRSACSFANTSCISSCLDATQSYKHHALAYLQGFRTDSALIVSRQTTLLFIYSVTIYNVYDTIYSVNGSILFYDFGKKMLKYQFVLLRKGTTFRKGGTFNNPNY